MVFGKAGKGVHGEKRMSAPLHTALFGKCSVDSWACFAIVFCN